MIASKFRAFLIHLGISATVVGAVFAIVFFVWYPHPYFEVIGAWNVVRILILVDLVLGPMLTLVVYRPKKPRLAFDLSVIAAIQLAALVYGTYVIYQERPYYAVFAVDRFEVLAKKDVDFDRLEDESLRAKPWIGPTLVVATMPEDPQEQQQLILEVVFDGKPDIERRPEYWHPYTEGIDQVLERVKSLDELTERMEQSAHSIDQVVEAHGGDADQLGFVPIVGKNGDFAVIIDKSNGMPVDVIDVDPWPEKAPESTPEEDADDAAAQLVEMVKRNRACSELSADI